MIFGPGDGEDIETVILDNHCTAEISAPGLPFLTEVRINGVWYVPKKSVIEAQEEFHHSNTAAIGKVKTTP